MAAETEFRIGKIQKLSAEVQAAAALRDGIVNGDIPPGTRLTEIRMAEQLGVSRATIRTAFHQLAQEGLLDQVPYTGWTVMSLSAHDAWELSTLRASLEALAARLVATAIARSGGGPAVGRIDAAFAALVAACVRGDRRAIADADFALHRTIVELAGHRRLAAQYAEVEQQVRIYIASSDALADAVAIVGQHQPIVDALKAGDAERAARAAIAHNEEEGEKLAAHLAARLPGAGTPAG